VFYPAILWIGHEQKYEFGQFIPLTIVETYFCTFLSGNTGLSARDAPCSVTIRSDIAADSDLLRLFPINQGLVYFSGEECKYKQPFSVCRETAII